MLPRGLRLNNPGNIEHGEKWRGLATDQPDSRFCKFVSPEYGIRAMCEIFQTYQTKHKLNTIEKILYRYAPPKKNGVVENDTEKYIEDVSKWTGFARDAKVDAKNAGDLLKLIPAFIRKEQGYNPYNEAQLKAGIALSF